MLDLMRDRACLLNTSGVCDRGRDAPVQVCVGDELVEDANALVARVLGRYVKWRLVILFENEKMFSFICLISSGLFSNQFT
jgi:hypothetical protein